MGNKKISMEKLDELLTTFIQTEHLLRNAVIDHGLEIDSAGALLADGVINGVKYQVQIIMQSDPEYFMPIGDIVLTHPEKKELPRLPN